jgi:FtsH-binding integral membrane protein
MEHKLDPEVKDALIDNPLVQTAFRDEKKEGEFMMQFLTPIAIISIILAVMYFKYDKGLDDLSYIVLTSIMLILVALLVGLYLYITLKTSAIHRSIRLYGVSILIGDLISFPINLHYRGRTISILIFLTLLCIGPMWFYSLYYKRDQVLRKLKEMNNGELTLEHIAKILGL